MKKIIIVFSLLIFNCGEVRSPKYRESFDRIESDNVEEFKKLMEENPNMDLNLKSLFKGHAPIHKAAKNGSVNTLKYMKKLVKEGRIDPNLSGGSVYKNKAIHYAAESTNLETFKILMGEPFNAKLKDRNYFNDTALHKVAEGGCYEILEYIKEKIEKGEIKFNKNNYFNSKKESPLHSAARFNNYKIFKSLLKSPFNFNPNDENDNSQNILHLLCEDTFTDDGLKILDMISKLIKSKKMKYNSSDIKDDKGNSPLHYAAMIKNKRLYSLLLKDPFKLNPNNKNNDNKTANDILKSDN